MYKPRKSFKIVALILLTSVLFIGVLKTNVISLKAQTTAVVSIHAALGGTTNPEPDTYEYDDGTTVTVTAIPNLDLDVVFSNWIIYADGDPIRTTANNPVQVTVSGGITYDIEPVFAVPINPPTVQEHTPSPTDAVVIVLSAAGGTTDPEPAIYRIEDATELWLTATPDSGWQFAHWVISGFEPDAHGDYPFDPTPTDNPYVVDHGYGNAYSYQPVFIPIDTTAPTPTPTPTGGEQQMDNTTFYALISVIIILIVLLIVVGAYGYKNRSK